MVAAFVYWVAVPGAVLGTGWGTDRLLGLSTMPGRGLRLGAGSALVLVGVALVTWATNDLSRRGHGTPNPLEPPRTLVTSGAYRLCRHPMFLGYDVAAAGVVLAVGAWGSLVVAYPLFLALQVRFLRREEERLVSRFGAAYRAYRGETPLLLPRFSRSR